MRALVTGAAGFAGSHLVDYLLGFTDWEIYAFVWERESIEHLPCDVRLHLVYGDICRADSIAHAVGEARPAYVFHLAAMASVPAAWGDPSQTIVTNISGEINLLQAILHADLSPRILIVGSADEYGLVGPEDLPIREETPFRPNNPYAVSKITQDMLGYQYFLSYGLPVVRVRPFNHIGPRQRESFVVAAFAKQIAEAEARLRPPVVQVGNLDAQRDFSDVRDIVRGYYLALTEGEPGEVYNMASERAVGIQQVLESLIALSEVSLQVEADPTRLRPSDVPVVVGDCHKFRERTGWRVEIPLSQSLRDIMTYWRGRVNLKSKAGEER